VAATVSDLRAAVAADVEERPTTPSFLTISSGRCAISTVSKSPAPARCGDATASGDRR
jgi:hypothetical protein